MTLGGDFLAQTGLGFRLGGGVDLARGTQTGLYGPFHPAGFHGGERLADVGYVGPGDESEASNGTRDLGEITLAELLEFGAVVDHG